MGDNREGLLTGEDEIRGAQRILLHTNLTNKIIQLLANVQSNVHVQSHQT